MASLFNARSPEGYERLMGRWSARLAPKLLQFAPVQDGESVLDVGCGTGSLTLAIAETCKPSRLVGIDISEPYVEFARHRSSDAPIQFDVGDACSLPYTDGEFDRALSQLVLQFIPEPKKAVAEMCRVVRSGGTVAACVWDNFGGTPHMRVLFDTAGAMSLDPDRSLFRPLTAPGEMEQVWTEVGLGDVVAGTVAMRFDFADFEDYWQPFTSGEGPAGQLVMGLPETDRERLKAQVRTVFLSGRADGPRSFAAEAWACKGMVP
jgi:SAM-dependent methyltransferase